VSSVDGAAWADELGLHDELFRQLAHHLPAELPEVRRRLAVRFAA
jgi:phosphoenolpyruvate carboxykinase (GTP)